jgi:4-hydroxybenzoate polyprenyltransferase
LARELCGAILIKMEKKLKKDETEGIFAIITILLLLFTAMLNPLISAGLAIGLLIVFAIYKFLKK